MPKLTGPLLSLTASGTLGKILVYMRRSGLDIVRLWVKPKFLDSVNQQTINSYFSTAVQAWKGETSGTHNLWNAYATKRGKPATYGFNYYIGSYVLYLIDHSGVAPTSPFLPPA